MPVRAIHDGHASTTSEKPSLSRVLIRETPFNCLLFGVSDSLTVAAATEHEDDRKNDDPGAVVVEDVA